MNKVILMITLLLPAGIADGAQRPEKWTQRGVWEKLKKEMSDSEVSNLLGEPGEKADTPRMSVWYYQQPSIENGARSYGFVRMKKIRINSQEGFEVYSYKEPDWELLQSQLEAEELARARAEEQARIEEQCLAAEKETERQQHQEQVERDSVIIKQQAAVKQVQLKKDMEALQLKRERERAELRTIKPKGPAVRYFFVLSIAFAGSAVVFAIARKRAES